MQAPTVVKAHLLHGKARVGGFLAIPQRRRGTTAKKPDLPFEAVAFPVHCQHPRGQAYAAPLLASRSMVASVFFFSPVTAPSVRFFFG